MYTIALITFIAIVAVFVWHVWMLVREFNAKPEPARSCLKTCKMVKNKVKGRYPLLPAMPSGDIIPSIVMDSIKIIRDDDDMEAAGLVKVQFQVFVKEEDIEGMAD